MPSPIFLFELLLRKHPDSQRPAVLPRHLCSGTKALPWRLHRQQALPLFGSGSEGQDGSDEQGAEQFQRGICRPARPRRGESDL